MLTTTIIMKYIITEKGPFVFSSNILHAEAATKEKVIAAGFVAIKEDEVGKKAICYGESCSLNIKSRLNVDSLIINKHLGFPS